MYIQWKFHDPKIEVLYHIRPYFGGISPYIGLIYGRYLHFRFLKWPLITRRFFWGETHQPANKTYVGHQKSVFFGFGCPQELIKPASLCGLSDRISSALWPEMPDI